MLDEIPNIGSKRKMDLLKKFGGVENIKKATLEELMELPSIDRRSAESIMNFFKR